MMRKTAAVIQIVFIVLLVGLATWNLFRGNFELSFAILPFLIIYYLFVSSRLNKR